jgi:hypothetical protein
VLLSGSATNGAFPLSGYRAKCSDSSSEP